LSYGFVIFAFAIDFISPLLQRHRNRYSSIVKTLLKRPLLALLFGGLFALPPILVGKLIQHSPELSLSSAIVLLFSTNIVCIAWAAVAGTWAGAQLLPDVQSTPRTPWPIRYLLLLAVLGLLAWNSFAFFSLGQAIHHKSQLLKCNYSVDWKSFRVSLPKVGLSQVASVLLGGKATLGLEFRVAIENPTAFDVKVERNRLEVAHDGASLATSQLAPFEVKAGKTADQQVMLKIGISPREVIAKGRELIQLHKWRITFYLWISDQIEFPIYLVAPGGTK
jgi:hypothetical protein